MPGLLLHFQTHLQDSLNGVHSPWEGKKVCFDADLHFVIGKGSPSFVLNCCTKFICSSLGGPFVVFLTNCYSKTQTMLQEYKPKPNSDKSTGCPSSFLFPEDTLNSWKNDLTVPSWAWRWGWIQDNLGERERENEWESGLALTHDNVLDRSMEWLTNSMTGNPEQHQ